MTKTEMIGLTCAAALVLAGFAEAQFHGYGLNEDGYFDVEPDSYVSPGSQYPSLDSAINPYGQSDPYGEIERGFERQDRWDAVTGCMMMDRNPAAQQRCLDALR